MCVCVCVCEGGGGHLDPPSIFQMVAHKRLKMLFYAKLQQILLKLVENICLQPLIGIYLRTESKNEIRTNFLKNLPFSFSNFMTSSN